MGRFHHGRIGFRNFLDDFASINEFALDYVRCDTSPDTEDADPLSTLGHSENHWRMFGMWSFKHVRETRMPVICVNVGQGGSAFGVMSDAMYEHRRTGMDKVETIHVSEVRKSDSWVNDFKERFQTIGSASLAWHPMLVKAFPSKGAVVVHTRDWTVNQVVPAKDVHEQVRRICESHGMHLAAHRHPGGITEQDRRSKSTRFWHFCYVGDKGCVVGRGASGYPSEVDGTVFDEDILNAIGEALIALDTPTHKEETAGMYYLAAGPQGIGLVHQPSLAKPLERGNYEEKTLEFYDRLVAELPKGDRGRLAIMTGDAGTGKTSIIKALLTDLASKCSMVYVPAALIPAIGRPELMPVLIEHHAKEKKPVLLILEDADEVLLPRGADNMSGISTLLNLTDGLQSDQADVRIVATSNARREKMDAAVGRRGRFFGHLDVPKRTPEHAQRIFARLYPEKPYPFPANLSVHLGEIYTGELDEDTSGRRRTGFST